MMRPTRSDRVLSESHHSHIATLQVFDLAHAVRIFAFDEPRGSIALPIYSIWPRLIKSDGFLVQESPRFLLLGGQRPSTPRFFTLNQIDKS